MFQTQMVVELRKYDGASFVGNPNRSLPTLFPPPGHFDDALARFVRCKGPSDEEKEKIMRTIKTSQRAASQQMFSQRVQKRLHFKMQQKEMENNHLLE